MWLIYKHFMWQMYSRVSDCVVFGVFSFFKTIKGKANRFSSQRLFEKKKKPKKLNRCKKVHLWKKSRYVQTHLFHVCSLNCFAWVFSFEPRIICPCYKQFNFIQSFWSPHTYTYTHILIRIKRKYSNGNGVFKKIYTRNTNTYCFTA